MRPVYRSTKNKAYDPYGTAKPELVDELGDYCSYCGKQVPWSALEVEHIYPKSLPKYAAYETNWNNFLLACKSCNTIKGAKDVGNLKPYLPHRTNLLAYIDILNGGLIVIKKGLTNREYKRIEEYIKMVGLDRCKEYSNVSSKDDRWIYRKRTYDIAVRQLGKYEQNPRYDLENMMIIAKGKGFFSVWYTVFRNHPKVLRLLIHNFGTSAGTGTQRNHFDRNYNPIKR